MKEANLIVLEAFVAQKIQDEPSLRQRPITWGELRELLRTVTAPWAAARKATEKAADTAAAPTTK